MKCWSRILMTAVVLVSGATVVLAAPSSNVLNKLEVQKLVAAETPTASLRLASHYNALAEQYFTDAARQRDIARVYRANANRSATTTAAIDCDRLANRAAAWGVRARQLARYHLNLAIGRETILPVGATALHQGYGAPEPTTAELRELTVAARTRADHLVLREYYSTLARRKTAEADNYLSLAAAFRAGVRNGSYDPAVGYIRLAGIARKAAKEATLAADKHQVLANIG